MIDGRIAGSWRALPGPTPQIVVDTYRPMTAPATRAVNRAIAHYTRFVG
jgi:hypothetical protein